MPAINKNNISLFNGLHQFLDNPKHNESKEKQLIGLSLLKAKRDIEEKIRKIEAKIEKGDF